VVGGGGGAAERDSDRHAAGGDGELVRYYLLPTTYDLRPTTYHYTTHDLPGELVREHDGEDEGHGGGQVGVITR